MPGPEFFRHSVASGPIQQLRRPSLDVSHHSLASASQTASRNNSVVTGPQIPEEKPIAHGNGLSVSVNLAEPAIFLQGHDGDDDQRSTAMLRGNLHLKVTKSAKLKGVSLKFRGIATTKWPEGIPPKRVDFDEVDNLMNHTWPFFNAQFPAAEEGTGADVVRLADGSAAKSKNSDVSNSPRQSVVNLTRAQKSQSLSLASGQSRSFEKNEHKGPTVAQKGYRTFHPGDYIWNFELPIDSRMPESIDVDLGSVKYELEALVERSGAFRANLQGTKELTLIRTPAEGSLEQVEPIAISRNWEDQLHYDIVISGKSFPLGAKVPIAFKLTPLAKVQCHRIKVFVTENTEYFCSNKRVHRMEPTRKVLLLEKRADSPFTTTFPGSTMRVTAGGGVAYDQRDAASRGEEVTTSDQTNLLGRLEGETNVGPTEMEFNVQLPGCQQITDKEKMAKLHFDTTYQNIQVHHWIKIVMRLSKPDAVDPTKRRHFEISIDSPFHILSCKATAANTALPAYTSPENAPAGGAEQAICSCPGAPARRVSPTVTPTLNSLNSSLSAYNGLARPPAAHVHNAQPAVQRPIHMMRAPSFNPPAFEDEEPPPPLVTPPPQYNDIASPNSGLTDYFSRLADTYDDEDSEGEHNGGRSRMRVPLTPGSRVNRSMDLPRSWVPVGN